MITPRKFVQHLRDRIRLNKKSFILYSILRTLVIFDAVRSLLKGRYENFALCLLALVLFLMPAFFEEKLKVKVPPLFEIIIYIYIYASWILGEVNNYYTRIPGWDTMLHTLNGFLCAAIGFALVDIMNRRVKEINLTPGYLALVAFCFSMTIGVVWEFIEFTVDSFFQLDMQKDFIVSSISSVTLDPNHSQVPYKISDITQTIIETGDGQRHVIMGGYLDIGLIDTMKDLIVNFIGAFVFSLLGYFYEKKLQNHEKETQATNIAGQLMLQTLSDEELEQQEKEIREREDMIAKEKFERKSKNAVWLAEYRMRQEIKDEVEEGLEKRAEKRAEKKAEKKSDKVSGKKQGRKAKRKKK